MRQTGARIVQDGRIFTSERQHVTVDGKEFGQQGTGDGEGGKLWLRGGEAEETRK